MSTLVIPISEVASARPRLLRTLSALHGAALRATGGRLFARWFGARLLLLETCGRRTGRTRVTPLV